MSQSAERSAELLKKTFIAFKKSQERLNDLEMRRSEPIAIIGMACRLPGGANDPALLWDLLSRRQHASIPVPPERWSHERFHHPDPDEPGRTHAVRANFLTVPVDAFDAPFFGISAKEAVALDPQQRLLLEWPGKPWRTPASMPPDCAAVRPASMSAFQRRLFSGASSFRRSSPD